MMVQVQCFGRSGLSVGCFTCGSLNQRLIAIAAHPAGRLAGGEIRTLERVGLPLTNHVEDGAGHNDKAHDEHEVINWVIPEFLVDLELSE